MNQITREELMTAPPGLYMLPDTKVFESLYDINSAQILHNVPSRLWARVREAGDIPDGVDVTIRPDGMQIIKQWTPDR